MQKNAQFKATDFRHAHGTRHGEVARFARKRGWSRQTVYNYLAEGKLKVDALGVISDPAKK